jgi:drug/metabolite transporter (DMT)-like permease
MAAAVLGAAVIHAGMHLPERGMILRVFGIGVLGFGVSVGAQFVGTDRSTAVNGALITSASPAFILIFAALLLKEPLTLQRIAAVALATIGVIVIVDPARADFSSAAFSGNIALVIAAITWGLYSVLVRKASAQIDTLLFSLIALFGGLALTIPAAAIELGTRPIGVITPGIIAGVLYLGIISTAAAMWLWNRAFALVDASIASLFFFAQPLVGALLSVIFLRQSMTIALWVGSGLILIGVLLSLVPSVRPRAALSPE